MAEQNAGATAGTTRVTLARGALDGGAQGAKFLKAVQDAVAGEFDVLGELGRGASGVIVYLAREFATGHLVALRFTPGDRTTRDAGEMWLEVLRRLDETVPAADTTCPQCGKPLRGWGRFCSQCGADLSGIAAGAAAGSTPEELMRAVREAARGRFEVLGEMTRTEGGGTVYFAKDLRDGSITALRLQKQTDAAGRTEQYKLGRTQVLRSVADLLGGPPVTPAAPAAPQIRLATALQEASRPELSPRAVAPTPRAIDRRRIAVAAAGVAVVGAAAVGLRWTHEAPGAQDPAGPRADSLAGVLASAAADSAEVQVGTALPPNATVLVDGRAASGPTIRLAEGAHTLRATAPGYASATQQLTLKAGQVVVWTPTLASLASPGHSGPTAAGRAGARSQPRSAPGQPSPRAIATGDRRSAPPGAVAVRHAPPPVPEAANTTASTCAGLFATLEWARALPTCERDAVQGSTSAQRAVATMYDRGLGTEQDYGRAASWYTKAADAGDPVSQYRLGMLFRDGHGVRRDERGSVLWLRRAADQGDANAQGALAWAYETGKGVRRDSREAVTWYVKAAEQGAVGAQLKLADLYEGGRDARYAPEAVRWLRRAAERGDAGAQYRLARHYAEGNGVAKSDADALAWFTKAAAAGNREARDELRKRGH